MRPIKFRAWDRTNKRMQYNFNPVCRGEWSVFNVSALLESWLMDYELMQFTGLLDRNGKEIWEGDIVETACKERGKIVFSNAAFWIEYLPPFNWDAMCLAELLGVGNCIILGNIWENPELLEGK
jgi:hypothetical protein